MHHVFVLRSTEHALKGPVFFPDNGFISCRYLYKRVIRATSQTWKVLRNLIDLIHDL